MTRLVDEALSRIEELGTIGAMKWLEGAATKHKYAGLTDAEFDSVCEGSDTKAEAVCKALSILNAKSGITKQPDALRLADAIDPLTRKYLDNLTCTVAANELRRLSTSEREGWRYADELEQDRKCLAEVNAELLVALKEYVRAGAGFTGTDWRIQIKALQLATSAITKATREAE